MTINFQKNVKMSSCYMGCVNTESDKVTGYVIS